MKNAFIFFLDINNLFNIKEKNDCPFIETLSFGSDFDIKCNNTYLIFNETNVSLERTKKKKENYFIIMQDKNLNWKFANQSSFCQQKGKHQAFVNQCTITRIGSKYLKVPVVS